jgi:tetratricopeptide (TPR) repeat protein
VKLRAAAWLLAVLCAAAAGAPRLAHAEPLWRRVREPGSAARSKARRRAEQLFAQATDARMDPELLRDLSLGSAALLELSGGAERDPWQAVLLGRVLLDAEPGRERDAARLIESGLPGLSTSEFKRESWFDLGLSYMLSGDFERAARAYTAALALAWDADDRATIYRNRGKARMLSGRLGDAVTDFRAAVRLAQIPVVVALSNFGLGVALERNGDYPAGMQAVALGVAVRLSGPNLLSESVLDLPTLRWIPEYDVHYFRALGAMSQAEAATDSAVEQERYEAALESWQQYLELADGKDRFVANAERHRQRCQEALLRLRRDANEQRRSGRAR